MITLTERAANRFKQKLTDRGMGIGIRLSVNPTGCSGLSYIVEYVDFPPVTRDQFVYESYGIKVWVNGQDLVYLNGTEIDFIKNGLNEILSFKNPNEKDRCGCGSSFTV